MKKLLLSAVSLCYFASYGQWISTPMVSACDVTYAFGKALASEGLVVGTGGLQSSSDNGATWAPSNTGVPSAGLIFGTNDGTNLYAFRQNSVYVSTTGNNWSLQASTMASSLAIKSMCVFNGTVMATASPGAGGSRIFHYVAGSWTQKSTTSAYIFTVIRNLGGTLYAGSTASNVVKSTDGGMTWTSGGAGMPTENCNKYVTALAASGSTLYHGTYGNKLMRSTDNGANWTLSYHLGDNNTFGIGMNDFYIHNANTVLVASDSGFVYTTNGGNSWTRYNSGLVLANAEWNMQRVTVSGGYVIAGVKTLSGAGAKVVRLPLSAIGLAAGINELSATGYESKVYPNPTSGILAIEVSDLAFDDDHTVTIYDALGKQVSTHIMSQGKVELNVENYGKGLYTFTVSNKGSIASRGKFVVN